MIENTQRDLNIALMNELVADLRPRSASTPRDVLAAAGTKWNFLPFTPGPGRRPLHRRRPLLPDRTRPRRLGYHPQVILAGRRINDGMGQLRRARMRRSC